MKPLAAYNYSDQLVWLEKRLEEEREFRGIGWPTRVQMLLSLAESVKEARDHALNCVPGS